MSVHVWRTIELQALGIFKAVVDCGVVKANCCAIVSRAYPHLSPFQGEPLHESIENVISCARSYRTLWDGSFGVVLSQALRARLRSVCPSGTGLQTVPTASREGVSKILQGKNIPNYP